MLRPLSIAVLAAAGVAYAVWVLTAGADFTIARPDDWSVIHGRPDPTVSSLFEAFNGHWSTLLVLTYQVMLRTVGLAEYTPWLGLVTAAHLLVVALVFAVVQRRAGPLIALASAVFVLTFSQGSEDMYWSFQIGFLGALASGLAALQLADGDGWSTRRSIMTTGAMLVALMWSGIGLVMCVATSVPLAARRRWTPIAGAALAYAAWTVGWSTSYEPREGAAVAYAGRAFEIVGELFAGPGSPAAIPLMVALVLAGVTALVRGWRPPALALGAVLGLAVLYGGVGLRAGFDPDFAEPSRYRYPALILVLLAITTFRAPRFVVVGQVAMAALLGLGLTNGVAGLQRSAVAWEHESLVFLAQVAVLEADGPSAVGEVVIEPSGLRVRAFLESTARWGRIEIDDGLRRRLAEHPYGGVMEAMRARLEAVGEP